MFNIPFSFTPESLFIDMMVVVFVVFLLFFFVSVVKNRHRARLYTLIMKPDGNLSKVGISFLFLWLIILYQVITGKEITGYFVELLGVIFAAELGERYVDNKSKLTNNKIDDIKDKLKNTDKSVTSAPAKFDDIEF